MLNLGIDISKDKNGEELGFPGFTLSNDDADNTKRVYPRLFFLYFLLFRPP